MDDFSLAQAFDTRSRMRSAAELGRRLAAGGVSEAELRAAEAVLSVLAEDPEPEVRLALAAELSASAAAPRHVVFALASDLPEIAAVTLSRTPVLLDGELLRFVREGGVEAQIAIACREDVSAAVADGIASGGGAEACLALLMNPTARTGGGTLHAIALRFGKREEIRHLLLERGDLEARTRVLLIETLAGELRRDADALEEPQRQRAIAAVEENREKSLIALAAAASAAEIDEICAAVVAAGQMNAAFLLRAVLMGNIALFVRAVAGLSGVAAERVEAVATGGQKAAFAAICARAGLPAAVNSVCLSAIAAWKRLLEADPDCSPAELMHGVALSVLSRYEPGEDAALDSLLLMLRRICAEAARECARREIGEIARRIADERRPALPAPRAPIEVDAGVVGAWAEHFAEELVDLEAEFAVAAAADQALAAETMSELAAALAEVDLGLPDAPDGFANDDRADANRPGERRAA